MFPTTDPLSIELSAYTDDSYEPQAINLNAGPVTVSADDKYADLIPAF